MLILGGSSRAYGFDLELLKSTFPSICSSSCSPASTLSENSNSSYIISTKRPRTPRKRPNQSYSEAAALLSTINPILFSSKNLHKFTKHAKPFSSLPPYSLLNEVNLLIEDSSPRHHKPSFRFKLKPTSPNEKSCIDHEEPSSFLDYDVGSILNEVGEGIDSIMGNLSIDNYDTNYSTPTHSCTGIGVGRNCISKAIRHNGDWWKPTTQVAVKDIVSKLVAMPSLEMKKKKSKSKKKIDGKGKKTATNTNGNKCGANLVDEVSKCGLGLRLNHEAVLEAWWEQKFPFTNESGTIESSADIHARLSEIDLTSENEGGHGEANVQIHKEKRKNRLISSNTKKVRYQVRKVNADCRPKMKASDRFAKSPDLVQETLEEENQ